MKNNIVSGIPLTLSALDPGDVFLLGDCGVYMKLDGCCYHGVPQVRANVIRLVSRPGVLGVGTVTWVDPKTAIGFVQDAAIQGKV